MEFFLAAYGDEEVVALTGLSRSTFITLWHKYCGPTTPIRKPMYLWWLFMYYKLYPVARAFRVIHQGRWHSPSRFLARLYVFEHLATVINELDEAWDRRHDRENRLPHVFGPSVVGSIDTFPIIINRPKRGNVQRLFYNGKYATHVVKVQGVCDHRGNIIWYNGPHLGVTSDIKVFRENPPPLTPGEKLLGDKAYVGERGRLIPPYKKRPGQARLSERKYNFNTVHGWYRATIEHCFAYVKRGHIVANGARLSAALKIIMHSNYIHTKDHPQRNHQPMDLDLDDVELEADAAVWDPVIGTGKTFDDFNAGDKVEVWYMRSWWHGRIIYKARGAQTLSVRFTGNNSTISDILPKHTRLVPA